MAQLVVTDVPYTMVHVLVTGYMTKQRWLTHRVASRIWSSRILQTGPVRPSTIV